MQSGSSVACEAVPQAVLLECDDGNDYIVKMVGCPQGANTLANKWLGSVLAAAVRLPVAQTRFISISDSFLAANPEMMFALPTGNVSTIPGLHVGSHFVGEPSGPCRAFQYLPQTQIVNLANRASFLGMLLFDIRAGQRTQRKAIFRRSAALLPLEAVFINHSHLFGEDDSRSPDPKLIACHYAMPLYSGLWSNQAVSSWIGTLRKDTPDVLSSAINMVPNHWYLRRSEFVTRFVTQTAGQSS